MDGVGRSGLVKVTVRTIEVYNFTKNYFPESIYIVISIIFSLPNDRSNRQYCIFNAVHKNVITIYATNFNTPTLYLLIFKAPPSHTHTTVSSPNSTRELSREPPPLRNFSTRNSKALLPRKSRKNSSEKTFFANSPDALSRTFQFCARLCRSAFIRKIDEPTRRRGLLTEFLLCSE